MKRIINTFLGLVLCTSLFAQDFEAFNALFEEMALSVADAKDDKEAAEIQKKYDVLIVQAEKKLEQEVQAEIIAEDQRLAQEEEELNKYLDSLLKGEENLQIEESKEWADFKDFISKAKNKAEINKKFTEKQLVLIAKPINSLPEFLKTTEGKKTDLVRWYWENRLKINEYD